MAVFHVNESDPTKDYFSKVSGQATVEERKKEFGTFWNKLGKAAQDAQLAEWESVQGDESKKSGVEVVLTMTAFLKEQSARTNPTEVARKFEVQTLLSVPVAKATEKKYDGKKKSEQVDLIDHLKNAVGISYKNLATWLYTEEKETTKVDGKSVTKIVKVPIEAAESVREEIEKRATNSGEGDDSEA